MQRGWPTTDKIVQLWGDQVPFPEALARGPGGLKCWECRTLQSTSSHEMAVLEQHYYECHLSLCHEQSMSNPRANHEQTMSKPWANHEQSMSNPWAIQEQSDSNPRAIQEQSKSNPRAIQEQSKSNPRAIQERCNIGWRLVEARYKGKPKSFHISKPRNIYVKALCDLVMPMWCSFYSH
jgi:hypothetical protein